MRALPLAPVVLALAFAGCVTGAPEEVDAASAPNAISVTTAASWALPIEFAGNFGPGFYACPLVFCEGQSEGDMATEVDHKGPVIAANLTMTWDATAPTMSQLRFGIMWEEDEMKYEVAEGTSPLVLQKDGLAIPADADIVVWAWVASSAPMEMVYVHTPQDFQIMGELTETS